MNYNIFYVMLCSLFLVNCQPPKAYLYNYKQDEEYSREWVRVENNVYRATPMPHDSIEVLLNSLGFDEAMFTYQNGGVFPIKSRDVWENNVHQARIIKTNYIFDTRYSALEKELIVTNTLVFGLMGALLELSGPFHETNPRPYNWKVPLYWLAGSAAFHITLCFGKEKMEVYHAYEKVIF